MPTLSKDPSETSLTVKLKPSDDPPPVIPPEHGKSRTLVLCFDGTSNQFGGYNSNVVQFVSLLVKDDRNKQLVYYQVGHIFPPTVMVSCLKAFRGSLELGPTPRLRLRLQ